MLTSCFVRPFRGLRSACVWCAAVLGIAALVGASDLEPQRQDRDLRQRFNLKALGPIPHPPDNQPRQERISLGRFLFFDPILGGERDVACGTCHHPDFAFADGRQFGAGVSGAGLGPQRVLSGSAATGKPIAPEPRNPPTILNTALAAVSGAPSYLAPMFWDGRAIGLEGQALIPFANRVEMRGDAFPGSEEEAAAVTLDSLLARLRGIPEYAQLFRSAFPDEAAEVDGGGRAQLIDRSTLARAIAAYERELVTRNSAFDRFVAGDDSALTEVQKQGLELFFTRAKCFVCHRGPMFSNNQFMVSGVPKAGPGLAVIPGDDTGREEHTGRLADRYKFRVPSLRNVELTAPYMHSGVFQTLEEVMEFYNGGASPRHANVTDELLEGVLIAPLGFEDEQLTALVQFLRSLTDPGSLLDSSLTTVPATVPSGLTPVFGVRGRGRG